MKIIHNLFTFTYNQCNNLFLFSIFIILFLISFLFLFKFIKKKKGQGKEEKEKKKKIWLSERVFHYIVKDCFIGNGLKKKSKYVF